jgi:hypothetical protein
MGDVHEALILAASIVVVVAITVVQVAPVRRRAIHGLGLMPGAGDRHVRPISPAEGRGRVLEVEDDHDRVGGQGPGLLQGPRVRGGQEQHAATRSDHRRAPVCVGVTIDAIIPRMGFLNARDEQEVRTLFEQLTGPVRLVVFSQSLAAADLCAQNEDLVNEVAALSDQIAVETLNLAIDRERAEAYGVDQVPAIVVEGARDYGIRFYGVPSGYEFSNLIDSILVASSGEPGLTEETKASLGALAGDVDIKVFSTPT